MSLSIINNYHYSRPYIITIHNNKVSCRITCALQITCICTSTSLPPFHFFVNRPTLNTSIATPHGQLPTPPPSPSQPLFPPPPSPLSLRTEVTSLAMHEVMLSVKRQSRLQGLKGWWWLRSIHGVIVITMVFVAVILVVESMIVVI